MTDYRERRYEACGRCGVKWYIHGPVPKTGYVCPMCREAGVSANGAATSPEPPRYGGPGEDKLGRTFSED